MSDIFKKASHYAETLKADDCHLSKKEVENYAKTDFQAGYLCCQKEYEEKLRWISVEEELKPKRDSKRAKSDFSICVLVKDIHGIPQSAYYNYKKKGFYSNAFSEHEIMCVTHWRYIYL